MSADAVLVISRAILRVIEENGGTLDAVPSEILTDVNGILTAFHLDMERELQRRMAVAHD